MGTYTIFRCSKILGEAGKQEILQQMFRKFLISNRLPNRYCPENCRWVPLQFDTGASAKEDINFTPR